MTSFRQSSVFGKRKEPHTIIIARGDQIRHFTVRPWAAALAGSALAAMAVGYLLATTYLVLRDDLIGATVARNARMQQAYEDRISALRAQVDRITSRQLLDQNLMEAKVAELLERQSQLAERQGRIAPLLDKANAAAVPTADPPVPTERPDVRAGLNLATSYAAAMPASPGPFTALFRKESGAAPSDADNADRLFVSINKSLRSIEDDQLSRLRNLAENAYQTAETISDALQSAGLAIADDYDNTAVGGPLIAVQPGMQFDAAVDELDEALSRLDTIKQTAQRLPLTNPAPGKQISSAFGVRTDPLLGTPALHAGMDFRATTGSSVRAAGRGEVVEAGWHGGYGRMVEIDHGNGWRTRYAHLSAITVNEGDKVENGAVIGKVGSTGRSTGPHLHYEVRRNGKPLNPLKFIKVGRTIAELI